MKKRKTNNITEQKDKINTKKNIYLVIKKIIKYICILCIILFILYSLIFNLNKILFKKEYFTLGSINLITGDSFDSMHPVIKNNDLIITKKIENYEIQEGEIYAYELNNKIYIQRLYSIKTDDGNIRYIFKGDNNLNPSIEEIEENNILGVVNHSIPILGLVAKIFQNSFVCLFIIICIIYVIIYCLIKRNRKKQINSIGKRMKR